MSMTFTRAPRTLALDPTSDGFCFAVLEGSETLLDWGCCEIKDRQDKVWHRKVIHLLKRYQPRLVVLEDPQESRRGPWASAFLNEISMLLQEYTNLRVVSRHSVKDSFKASGTTKYEIAVAIARLFPELEARLPRKRKPWMSEDERMNIFDALSFALTVLWADSTHAL
jgi:hypothetical protein